MTAVNGDDDKAIVFWFVLPLLAYSKPKVFILQTQDKLNNTNKR
jgi:hypothetical protein